MSIPILSKLAATLRRPRTTRAVRSVQLREMHPNDWPVVLRIERESFQYPDLMGDLIRHFTDRRMWDQTGFGFVAELYGRIVGHMLFDEDHEELFLKTIVVDPVFRGQGIGSIMLHELKQSCFETESELIGTVVRESNMSALGWFSHRGFIADQLLIQPFLSESPVCEEDGITMVWRPEWQD